MDCLVGRRLSFCYRTRAVLRDVDVTVRPGRVHVLVGPSGSGKTTLLWLLAGLLEPAGGATGLGQDGGADGLAAVSYRRTRIGMVFQQSALWSHLTVRQHLRLVLSGAEAGRSEKRDRIDRILDSTGLAGLSGRRPGELSGGERQRLAIARALVVAPQWLLLDEPLAHLDGTTRDALFDLLRRLLRETRAGVLMATHNAAEALRIADYCTVMGEGRVLQDGPVLDVYRRPVSLDAALALGPAGRLNGEAHDGRLHVGDRVVLEGIDAARTGPTSLILRPEAVGFAPDAAGPAEVISCEFTPAGYRLTVTVAGQRGLALHTTAIAVGTRGNLACHKCSRREGS
jgi:ABC-type sulfate/molybdate transport systems ATPase subunit